MPFNDVIPLFGAANTTHNSAVFHSALFVCLFVCLFVANVCLTDPVQPQKSSPQNCEGHGFTPTLWPATEEKCGKK
jgi:hypothetical protein